MIQSAYNSLTVNQLEPLNKHCKIVSSDINTIETCGGGSARWYDSGSIFA